MTDGVQTSRNVKGSRSSLSGSLRANAILRQKVRKLEDGLKAAQTIITLQEGEIASLKKKLLEQTTKEIREANTQTNVYPVRQIKPGLVIGGSSS
jgi:hypothetical protein